MFFVIVLKLAGILLIFLAEKGVLIEDLQYTINLFNLILIITWLAYGIIIQHNCNLGILQLSSDPTLQHLGASVILQHSQVMCDSSPGSRDFIFVKKNLHVAKDVIIILLTLSEDVF